ncbi:pentatricopeptide repeat-containing protein At4g21190 [Cornus florida]|uniref:pentatricopeptide repeat-containing protein At4g21190 n=1 Tax=Cornus florida TaxID=4283 RepID=UPI00289C417B|nr:pentatricopeptide repeat-containing protein At4g21190 [Cornus florida]
MTRLTTPLSLSPPLTVSLTTFSSVSLTTFPSASSLLRRTPTADWMLSLRYPAAIFTRRLESIEFSRSISSVVVCAAKGPRPRYPRVWKTNRRIGTISKSVKFAQCVKDLSNVKEEVYGALDSFIAWELEFPLITVKKAIKLLETEKEWKRIIQVTKWMLSKGQGTTMGSYFILLNALAEDGRLDEAEELWMKLFSENLESTPRMFFDKMIAIYYRREMHEKMFEVFADMEELGIRPTTSIVSNVGDVFQKLGMLDKYEKLKKKYPPSKWEYRYIKGKRVKIRSKHLHKPDDADKAEDGFDEETNKNSSGMSKDTRIKSDELDDEANPHDNSEVSSDELDVPLNFS